MPKSIQESLDSAAAALLEKQMGEPRDAKLEAQLLLQHVLKINRAWLIAHAGDALEPAQSAIFARLLDRRLQGEPIAHILGEREFFGLTLNVTADTLIPRPDTETLVEAALEKMHDQSLRAQRQAGYGNPDNHGIRIAPLQSNAQRLESSMHHEGLETNDTDTQLNILDLGTGTGAIALAIAKHHPQAHVTAVDFSESALAIARENAEHLTLKNVQLLQSNWFSALQAQRFDMIVSNPPYIAENNPHLSQGDVRFEPKSALTSGADGLDDIRHIIAHATDYLKPNGWLMLEHGYDQAEAVAQLLAKAQFCQIGHRMDLAGIQRVTFGMVSPMIST